MRITDRWFLFFLKKAVLQRKGRFLISSLAVAISVTVFSALVTLSGGISERLGEELKSYGANVIVTLSSGGNMSEEMARNVATADQAIRGHAFQVYGSVSIGDERLEAVGADSSDLTGFRMEGRMPEDVGEVAVGKALRNLLKAEPGSTVSLNDGSYLTVTGVFETGTDDDSSLYLSLPGAMRLLGVDGISAVLLNVESKRLEDVVGMLSSAHPDMLVKTLRQVAVAEEKLLRRIQLLMTVVTAVVVFSAAVALGSTMGANVIERTGEIGLMKAVGASSSDIRDFFLYEAAATGLVGAVAGYILGTVVAEAVSSTAFGAFVPLSLWAAALSPAIGIVIAVASTVYPVLQAMRLVPAIILRGE